MFPLTRNKFGALCASCLMALVGFATPANSDELAENLGPVGPHSPILTEVGDNRVIAFYIPSGNVCALHAIVWNQEENTGSPTRVRVRLQPGAVVHIDSDENQSLNLQCGEDAETLAVVEESDYAAFGIEQSRQPITANAARF